MFVKLLKLLEMILAFVSNKLTMSKPGPQAGRFTSRREKSHCALSQDKFYLSQLLHEEVFISRFDFHIRQGDCGVRPS